MSFLFADVILPLPLKERFTYSIPFELGDYICKGMRVCVPFGPSKIYAGIVCKLHNLRPSYPTKEIISVLDKLAIVNDLQIDLWSWISSYYMCSEGEVMACALPSGFQLNSETTIVISPLFSGEIQGLDEKQLLIVQALAEKKQLNIHDISDITGQKNVFSIIKNLRQQNIIWVKEEISERYKPLRKTYLHLADEYSNNADNRKELMDKLEKKSYNQLHVLLAFFSLSVSGEKVKKAILTTKIGEKYTSALNGLIKKGILITSEQQVSRMSAGDNSTFEAKINELTEAQESAYSQIKTTFETKSVCLLHGVTSSGKTEIYMKLIEEVIAQGKQVLYLLPEIALTSQMIGRLKARFGDIVGVYHSKYNEHEKIEIWQSVSSHYKIILGARSAVFLPFTALGLIVVDEEHETSYKQQDPAPRYHARDAAIYLAILHKAKVLLGSATPSIESYFNALHKKFGLATLFTRHAGVKMPTVWTANMKEESRNKKLKGHFSSFLIQKIEKALDQNKQIMLFQNRRGFSTFLECPDCKYTPKCVHCDVTLTYHKSKNILLCHYCGYTLQMPELCPQCGSRQIKFQGFGTEKIEEDLQLIFPKASIARMDLDSTRGKNSHEKLISDFEEGKINILVGTQMITKGLDFDNVGVVGVLNADSLLFFPDFRSYERGFQLMTQVSGRAGRREGKEGEVVIQSYNPEHEIIRCVLNTDYSSMFESQLKERQNFFYPPYCRLIRVSLKHKEEEALDRACDFLSVPLRKCFGKRVLGPEFPMVSRISTFYIKNFLIKLERQASLDDMKAALSSILSDFSSIQEYRSCKIVIDVDPY